MELWYESLDYSCITPKSLLGALRETENKRVLLGWKKTVLNWRSNQYIFTSLPLFSSLYTPPSPTTLSFISKRKNRKRVMSVGGKLRTWPGTEVELSWTRKQSARYWTFAHKSSPILKSILHLLLHTLAQKGTKNQPPVGEWCNLFNKQKSVASNVLCKFSQSFLTLFVQCFFEKL